MINKHTVVLGIILIRWHRKITIENDRDRFLYFTRIYLLPFALAFQQVLKTFSVSIQRHQITLPYQLSPSSACGGLYPRGLSLIRVCFHLHLP